MVKNITYSVGGGVCLYVKSKYCVNVCENLTVNDGYSDSLFIEMNTIYAKKRIVGIIYRPPGFNPDIFRLKLEETLYHIIKIEIVSYSVTLILISPKMIQ